MIRLAVDADLCAGHGRCYTLAPEVFAPDDEGYNAARGEVVEVGDDRADAARRAARGCPEGAIRVLDEPPDAGA